MAEADTDHGADGRLVLPPARAPRRARAAAAARAAGGGRARGGDGRDRERGRGRARGLRPRRRAARHSRPCSTGPTARSPALRAGSPLSAAISTRNATCSSTRRSSPRSGTRRADGPLRSSCFLVATLVLSVNYNLRRLYLRERGIEEEPLPVTGLAARAARRLYELVYAPQDRAVEWFVRRYRVTYDRRALTGPPQPRPRNPAHRHRRLPGPRGSTVGRRQDVDRRRERDRAATRAGASPPRAARHPADRLAAVRGEHRGDLRGTRDADSTRRAPPPLRSGSCGPCTTRPPATTATRSC